MNWDSVIEGTVAGVAASAALGAGAFSYSRLRDWRLHKKITDTLARFSTGQGLNGVTIGISNYTSTRITIRSVSFSGAKSRYRLNPAGETSTLSIDRGRKLTTKEMEDLKAGKEVLISQEVGFTHSWQETAPVSGFIEIAPYTSHTFLLPAQLLADFDDRIEGILVIAEYTTPSGRIDLVEGKIIYGMDALNNLIGHYVGQIKSGALNVGRARFGLPAIKLNEKRKA
jgi:hypothetical protein